MKHVPQKFRDQAIFQSSLSPLPDMSRRFLAVGLVVVLGVAVKNEPSDDTYDLDTPEYGLADVSEDAAPVLPEVAEEEYGLANVSEDAAPVLPEELEGDGMVAAEEGMGPADFAWYEDSEDEGVEVVGEGEKNPPVPNPLGAFLEATQHIDVDLYAQEPGCWQRLITRAWKQACRLHHPDARGDHMAASLNSPKPRRR